MHDDVTSADSMGDGSDDLLIRRAARELRAPVAFGADFDARVMAAVRAAAADEAVEQRIAAPASTPRRAWAWVVRPRTLRVSPLAGFAVAAGLAFVMVGVARQEPTGQMVATQPVATRDSGTRTVALVPPVALTPGSGSLAEQPVQFVLVAPSAKSVALVGDFNDWSATATPLEPVRQGGVWTITVPLPPGRYTYNFVVDGSRVLLDPTAPSAPADDFGTAASIVTVAGAQS